VTFWQRRTKRLTYRDQLGQPQEVHQAHWAGFEWEAGNTIVAYVGDWGTVQVWAQSEAEGRRVIGHACAVAGIPTSGAGVGEWVVTTTTSTRQGKPGRFVTGTILGRQVVSKRNGPSGPVMV